MDELINIFRIQNYKLDPNVVNIYPLGSRVYGSFTEDSDYDYILVVKEWFDSNDINIHVYTISQFELALKNHDIQALECFYLPKDRLLKYGIYFDGLEIDKSKLRVSISTIASNSWVKGKKKLIVSGDYDLHLAIKSIFHSLRILDFGIQISHSGSIHNYGSMNYILEDLKKLSIEYQRIELWEAIDTKYRKLFNSMSSKFKLACPKETSKDNKLKELEKLFKNNNISLESSKTLLEDIYNLFDK